MTLLLNTHVLPGASVPSSARSDSIVGPTLTGIVIIMLFFGLLGGWAAVAPLNGAVVGDAVVRVEGNRKSVQHLEGGIVKAVTVRDGDFVHAGDILVVLDDTRVSAEAAIYRQQNAVLQAIEARVTAELEGLPTIRFPQGLRDSGQPFVLAVMLSQQGEFEAQRSAMTGTEQILRKRIAELDEQIVGKQSRVAAYRAQLESTLEERAGLMALLADGLTTRTRAFDLDRSASDLQGMLDDTVSAIAAAGQTKAELEQQIEQLSKDRRAEIAADLSDVQSKLLDLAPRVQAAQASLARMEIRSPYEGKVVGLSVFSTGAVIAPGQTILDIVPGRSPLVVEAQIRVEDISDLHPGMVAEIHFTAYKQRTTPLIHGRVGRVSADRLTDSRTGFPYYVAEIAVDETELAKAPQISLYPGMPAVVMIPTEERTALDYLLGPLVRSFDGAFRQK